ncbi:hypothetical protein GEMRC1_013854 [Eukaryota sp. GEM-RC1]
MTASLPNFIPDQPSSTFAESPAWVSTAAVGAPCQLEPTGKVSSEQGQKHSHVSNIGYITAVAFLLGVVVTLIAVYVITIPSSKDTGTDSYVSNSVHQLILTLDYKIFKVSSRSEESKTSAIELALDSLFDNQDISFDVCYNSSNHQTTIQYAQGITTLSNIQFYLAPEVHLDLIDEYFLNNRNSEGLYESDGQNGNI